MSDNAYFQAIEKEDKWWLEVHPPEAEGQMFSADEVIYYLDSILKIDYDSVGLSNYISGGDFSELFFLTEEKLLPEAEHCEVSFSDNAECAFARFYPPTTGGALLTESDLVSDLKMAGVKHGIKKKAIDHFLENHEYCRDYVIAEATPPIQGRSASVKYFFDANTTAKPKLNEDGSVDFHDLGMIKEVHEGDKLAELTPMKKGVPGVSVKGTPLSPKKVKNRSLRFGRNIRLSQDRCTIYSMVSGHVTLVGDMVMVSNIYQVPANVDSSTGDIVYQGTVQVTGNVNTGFKIEAAGDIIVNGVVEGATLISGGNIVLRRGMQGMERGKLQAEGNITAKFLESCEVSCKGSLSADAVLNSKIECREDIRVLGKKGLINGGSVRTYGSIYATTLGSTMGATTVVEVISDIDLVKRVNSLGETLEEMESKIAKIDQAAENIRRQIETGQEVMPEQMQYIRQAAISKPSVSKEIREARHEREDLQKRIRQNKNANIRAEGFIYPGVKLVIKDVSRIVHEQETHCKYVREGADIRSIGL